MQAVLESDLDDGSRVLGEARAAEARARMQELGADPRVESHSAGHGLDIGTEPLAEMCHLVDEGDLGGQEAVGGVLDQLGALHVGDHEWNIRHPQR